MKNLKVLTNPKVNSIFDNYPGKIRIKMIFLRQLVLTTAKKIEIIQELEETLNWSEPSLQPN